MIIEMPFFTITLVRIIVKMILIIKENVKRLYQQLKTLTMALYVFQKNSLKPSAKVR